MQIKSSGEELNGLVDSVVCVPWRLSYLLELPADMKGEYRIPDGQNRSKVKWGINKAAKAGVTVRPAESEADLRQWYRLYLETMRRSLVPPRPLRFFMGMWNTLRPLGMMEVLVAEFSQAGERVMLAGSIFLMFGHTVSYAFNGMDRRFSALRANDAIQWRAINDALLKRFHYFDFGEVPDGHTELAHFKSKWGAQPTRLFRYYRPPLPAPVRAEPAGARHYVRSLAEDVWRRIPLKATEWIGDVIYGFL